MTTLLKSQIVTSKNSLTEGVKIALREIYWCTKVHHMPGNTITISVKNIQNCIYALRGQKVMLDEDLADLYQVETKVLVRAMKRNIERFPLDFMFQLTKEECINLRCQIGTSSRGGRRYLPYAFTEQGVAMLSSILRSKRALQVNIEIMRTFVKMRKMLLSYAELSSRIDKLEESYDEQFRMVFDAIRQLMMPDPPHNDRPLGFRLE